MQISVNLASRTRTVGFRFITLVRARLFHIRARLSWVAAQEADRMPTINRYAMIGQSMQAACRCRFGYSLGGQPPRLLTLFYQYCQLFRHGDLLHTPPVSARGFRKESRSRASQSDPHRPRSYEGAKARTAYCDLSHFKPYNW